MGLCIKQPWGQQLGQRYKVLEIRKRQNHIIDQPVWVLDKRGQVAHSQIVFGMSFKVSESQLRQLQPLHMVHDFNEVDESYPEFLTKFGSFTRQYIVNRALHVDIQTYNGTDSGP